MTSIYKDEKGSVFARIDLGGHEYYILSVGKPKEPPYYILAEHSANGFGSPLAETRPPAKEGNGGSFERIDVIKSFCDFLFRHHFLMEKIGDDYLKN